MFCKGHLGKWKNPLFLPLVTRRKRMAQKLKTRRRKEEPYNYDMEKKTLEPNIPKNVRAKAYKKKKKRGKVALHVHRE